MPTMKTAPTDRPLRGVRFVVVLVLFLLAFGLAVDLLSRFSLLRFSRSWTVGAIGLLALGVLAGIGEAVGGWISGRDKITDPLWKRVWHLALLLGFVLVLAVAFGAVERMTQ